MSLEPGNARLRASDADRDAVVERLQEAHAQGRLDATEFDDRLDAAYAARTHGDLALLTGDLPSAEVTGHHTRDEPDDSDHDSRGLRGSWAVWATAVLVNSAVWGAVSASAGELVYFWPIWVAGPWGAALLARTIFGDRGGDREPERRRLES